MTKESLAKQLLDAFARVTVDASVTVSSPEEGEECLEQFFALEDEVKKWLLPRLMILALSLSDNKRRRKYFSRLIEFLDVDFDDVSGCNGPLKSAQMRAVRDYDTCQAAAICDWLRFVHDNFAQDIDNDQVMSAITYWSS